MSGNGNPFRGSGTVKVWSGESEISQPELHDNSMPSNDMINTDDAIRIKPDDLPELQFQHISFCTNAMKSLAK